MVRTNIRETGMQKKLAGILSAYTKYNSRRKPELLSPDTYSLINYREAETIEAEYDRLAETGRNHHMQNFLMNTGMPITSSFCIR